MAVILMLLMTVISLTMIILAHRRAKEKLTSQGIAPLFIFLAVYYLMLGVAWLGVARDLVIKRMQKW